MRTISFCLLLLFHGHIFSQAIEYDLKNYKWPELNRATKEFNGNSIFNNINIKDENGVGSSTFDFQLAGGITSSLFNNTVEFQQFKNVISNVAFNIDERNTTSGFDKSFIISGDYLLRDSRKRFVNYNEKFTESELNIRTDISYENARFATINEWDDEISGFASLSNAFYWGKGRIEFVNDAWNAVTILEMLNDRGVLSKTQFTESEITDFAEEIARIKNLRNTDFRLEAISELEALVGWLKNHADDPLEDVRFFATLLDTWEFENFTQRRSGKEFKIGVRPGIGIVNLGGFGRDDEYRASPNAALIVAYQINIPKSIDWQYRFSLEFNQRLNYDFSINESESFSTTDALTINPSFRANWSLSYLPSQRTNYFLSAGINLDYFNVSYENEFLDNQSAFRSSVDLDASFRYYISPQLIWNLSINVDFDIDDNNNITLFSGNDLFNRNNVFAGLSYFFY